MPVTFTTVLTDDAHTQASRSRLSELALASAAAISCCTVEFHFTAAAMHVNFFNVLPIVSQFKSAFQAICGDADGARRTQEEFSKGCPVISQLRSLVEVSCGNPDAARQTQEYQAQVLLKTVERTPVVGHITGGVYHALGDHANGTRVLNEASKTTVVMAVGVPLAIFAPLAAPAASLVTAAAYDGCHSAATGRCQGFIAAGDRLVHGKMLAEEGIDLVMGLALAAGATGLEALPAPSSEVITTAEATAAYSAGAAAQEGAAAMLPDGTTEPLLPEAPAREGGDSPPAAEPATEPATDGKKGVDAAKVAAAVGKKAGTTILGESHHHAGRSFGG
jgi:hypothetical protein